MKRMLRKVRHRKALDRVKQSKGKLELSLMEPVPMNYNSPNIAGSSSPPPALPPRPTNLGPPPSPPQPEPTYQPPQINYHYYQYQKEELPKRDLYSDVLHYLNNGYLTQVLFSSDPARTLLATRLIIIVAVMMLFPMAGVLLFVMLIALDMVMVPDK